MSQESMNEAAREWLASRAVIAAFLREMRPDLSQAQIEHNAAAVLARLASHKPPILTSFADRMDDADRLREQRDALLAACKKALADYEADFALACDPTPVEEPQGNPLLGSTVHALREAVALAEEET